MNTDKNSSSWDKQTSSWKESIADDNVKTLKAYRLAGQTWRMNAKKMEDASYGKSHSRAEIEQLLLFRQAPTPVPFVTAIMETAEAMMLSSKANAYVATIIFPRDQERTEISRKVAAVYTQLLSNSWYNSLGDLQLDKVVKDSGRVGHGLMFVVPRNEFGEFIVDFKHLSWRYFFPDPYSKDPLYRDMENSVYSMPMTVSGAYRLAKGIDPSLTLKAFKEEFVNGSYVEDMSFEEDNTYFQGQNVGKDSGNVLFTRRAKLEETKVFIVIPLDQKINFDGNDISFRVYPEVDENLARLAREKKIKIIEKTREQLVEYTSIGNFGRRKTLAITDHDIVAFTHDHRDTPFPYGRMWKLYPLQRAMNKFIASAILNQSLLNNVRILSEKGSISNMKKWVMNASMPGVALEYKLVTPGYSKPPEIVKATPMSGEWLVFPRYLTYMAEYISGVFGTMMGNPNDSPNVFSTVASLQSAGGQKFKRRMGYMDAALSHAGRVAASYYRDYSPPNGFNVAIDPLTGKENLTTFNTLDLVAGATPDSKKKLVVKGEDDLSKGFRDVRFTTRASAGYEAATEAAMLTQLATQTKSAGLIPMILERLNMPGTDKYLAEQSEANQLKQRVAKDQQVIKELESRTKTMQNQIVQAMYRIEQAKFKGNLDVELEKFKKNPVAYLENATNNQGSR